MSFLSRIFGRKDTEDGLSRLDRNLETGGVRSFPKVDVAISASFSGTNSRTPAKNPNAVGATQPVNTSFHPPAGTIFNQGDLINGVFRVENVLAGGMGVVYVCRQLRYEELPESLRAPYHPSSETGSLLTSAGPCPRYQVFKSFRRELLFHGDARERFNHEAILWLSLLSHPNVVRARTFDKAVPLLMLDYVDGGDLSARLGKPIALHEVARIAMQFCNGMIFLFESAGIVHRDIKPANILLARDGTVKITDFGLAKAFSPLRASTRDSQGADSSRSDTAFATQCGCIMGSLAWMSPEQFAAPAEVTVTSDVYSFGVVLYEMLTGRMPYVASSVGEWYGKILHEVPVSPERASGADEEVSAIVMKCLEKRPVHRFRDFLELREVLERWAVRNGWSHLIPKPLTFPELESAMTANDWMLRGYSFGQLGRSEESYQSYLRALELDPTQLGIHTNIGSALMRLGRFEEGLRHHRKGVEIHPTLALAWDTLASDFLWYKGLPQSFGLREAFDASRRASELAPDNISILRRHAFIARRAGAKSDYDRAVAAIKALLDRPENDKPSIVINQAIQFLQDRDPDLQTVQTGVDLHALSVKKYPESAVAWFNFGVTAQRLQLLEQAIDFYSRALNLNDQWTMAWIYRGVVRARRREYELAQSDWRAACAVDPKNKYSQMVSSLATPARDTSPQLRDRWEEVLKSWIPEYVM